MGEDVFENCTNLLEIYSLNPEPPIIEKNTFNYHSVQEGVLYVPKGSLESYKNAEYWQDFFNIVEKDPEITKVVEITSPDSELKIYSIKGEKLNIRSMDNLPSGIYIVNGKKIIVK